MSELEAYIASLIRSIDQYGKESVDAQEILELAEIILKELNGLKGGR